MAVLTYSGSSLILRMRNSSIPEATPVGDLVFNVGSFDNLTIDKTTGVTVMPLPEDDGETAFVIKLQGAKITADVEFTISDDGTDKLRSWDGANWVDTGIGETLWAQITALLDEFDSGLISKQCWLYVGVDWDTGLGGDKTIAAHNWKMPGQPESMNIRFEPGNTQAKVRMKIAFGLVV